MWPPHSLVCCRCDAAVTECKQKQEIYNRDVVNIIGLIIRGVSVMRYSKHMQNVYKKPANPKHATALHGWLHDITRKIKQYLRVSWGWQHYIQHCYTPAQHITIMSQFWRPWARPKQYSVVTLSPTMPRLYYGKLAQQFYLIKISFTFN